MTRKSSLAKQGLYDPAHEHDACGVGFIANIEGTPSHELVRKGVEALLNLEHRGACGCDPDTGDGAGILIQLPDPLMRREAAALGFELPPVGQYAVGMIFLSENETEASWQASKIEEVAAAEGQRVLGWRDVPHHPEAVGRVAREELPRIRQVFIAAQSECAQDQDAFERKLYVIRRIVENAVVERDGPQSGYFYVPSFSSRTLCYVGLLISRQIDDFYPDLTDDLMVSALAMVHSRYSTNTMPTWNLSHPFRYLAHNGEINTLRGNRNAMQAREGTMESSLFGDDLKKLYPIMREGASDSAQFDNVLEFLVLAGRTLPEALLMMIPEAWENQADMDPDLAAFYEYHSFLMEPWDGPASLAFTDGRKIGAVLDRNGLRPSRYIVTKDGMVVMSSEVGVLDIEPENILVKGRLHPGKIFLVDLEAGRIIDDGEIKTSCVKSRPYKNWVDENRLVAGELPAGELAAGSKNPEARFQCQQAFGYTAEDLKVLIAPMAVNGKWPIGSMGDDTALACLSDRPQMLYRYFKQLFAQVTNPAMDSINERPVMALYSPLGDEKNILDETEAHARMLRVSSPIITDEDLARIRGIAAPGFATTTLPCLFKVSDEGAGLRAALTQLCEEAERAVRDGANILILSDRGVSPELAPIPMLSTLR